MHAGSSGLLLIPVAVLLSAGCSSEEVVGHYWAITATGITNECTTEVPVEGEVIAEFEYRIQYDGTNVEVAIGPDVFATGTANGCQLSYESIVWTEERDGMEVSWQIFGVAVAQQGGTACNVANGTDWQGTETFEVVTSQDPSIAPGCEYEMALEGKYLEEVK